MNEPEQEPDCVLQVLSAKVQFQYSELGYRVNELDVSLDTLGLRRVRDPRKLKEFECEEVYLGRPDSLS